MSSFQTTELGFFNLCNFYYLATLSVPYPVEIQFRYSYLLQTHDYFLQMLYITSLSAS